MGPVVTPAALLQQQDVLELFTFSVRGCRYAVDLARVEEVLSSLHPEAPPTGIRPPVTGLVLLRGERVPVVDLRALLQEGPAPAAGRPGLLVCWVGRRRVAFSIDGVGAVAQVAVTSLRLPGAAEEVPSGVVAVFPQPPGVLFLLDLVALLRGKSLP